MNIVKHAIKYAGDPKNDGAGYFLRIFLARQATKPDDVNPDNVVFGTVVAFGDDWVHLEVDKNTPVFISTNFVEKVEVVW